MKFTSSVVSASAFMPLAYAFPRGVFEALAANPDMVRRSSEVRDLIKTRQTGADSATLVFEPVPYFSASEQYIDVSEGSGHEWVAPTSDDLRGPCPGLNAMANHGFLPHNGVATIEQYINATNTVVGMGLDLAGFLALLGAFLDGDLTSWSMGGTPTVAQGGLLGPLGNGLIGSHNKYESDASPTRPDLYQAGNDYITQADQFQQFINACPDTLELDCITEFRSQRFDTQTGSNPYFFNGPFSGVAVQPAAYTFIFRYMANHSAEYPVGILDHDVFASWFGITGENGNYKANQGYERIPDNWYRRALNYDYGIPYFLGDLIAAATLHPKFIDIGGNTGKVNTFTGVNVTDLTGGIFNGATLLEGNNLGCFFYQLSTQAKPDAALGVLNALTNAVGDIVTELGCPQLEAIDASQLEAFPGYSKNPVYGTN